MTSWARKLFGGRLAAFLLLLPSIVAVGVCVYGFIGWTAVVSFTTSTMTPRFDTFSLRPFELLFSNSRWLLSLKNLFIFSLLFIPGSIAIGIATAVLLDRDPFGSRAFRTLFLFPMALSQIVVGVAWKWLLSPHVEGDFDWITRPDRVVFTIVIAAIWQSSGFVMALFFAGLRGLSAEVRYASQVDGASLFTMYRRILLPQLKPVLLSCAIVLVNNAVKTFDLVLAMTAGGPGYSSDFPAYFMYVQAFQRNQLAIGAASAMVIFCVSCLLVVPQFRKSIA